MWRVASACPRECVAQKATEEGMEEDSRSPFTLRPTRCVEKVAPPECRGFLVVGNQQFRRKHRGRMTSGPGGIGPWVYLIHLHKSVGLGLRKGP